ncbi:polysulfide reductase [Actinobacteria bacterium YIM 96077]|uniref:Polysulfide reductase n=1 Tax=Phytoactinopolyspora halophila TaxID=1981511 RepID=A0A329QRA5_9ACTN|nr:NrfD/PsrC family molybdoenzyme membrane anchor subunit [Phytoactinopolyspora halophila]AYY15618.1 polysulfide reductase [Actinobacteria bacterium YIM 96077]RAW14887.1 polysulfide reductase [Phytoactinopolyspora halophila]
MTGTRASTTTSTRASESGVEYRSYYGQPVIKRPTWKTPDVPVYFFLGGLAGGSSVLAELGELSGRFRLARAGQVTAAAASAGSVFALIHDLGRPERFLNMLRVFKPTSPLSVGSWVLASYGTLAGAGAVSRVAGVLPPAGRCATAGAAALGPVMTTYTAVLVADTAVPAWHEGYRELPFVFAGSALASAGGLGMLAAPREAGPARLAAVAGTGMELAADRLMSHRLGFLAEPYHHGRAGRWMRAGKVLGAAGAAGALGALVREPGRRGGRVASVLSAISASALLASSLCTRFGVFEAGRASADDPKYTVVPQRERLDARNARNV